MESFLQRLKRERIRRRNDSTRDEAKSDMFDYIEVFYNVKRKHGSNDRMSSIDDENRHQERLRSVSIIGGDSGR